MYPHHYTAATYRLFNHVVIIVVVGVVVVVDVVMVQVIGVAVAVVFGQRRQRDVRLETPAELFGLRVRYDLLRVHQPRRSLSLDQTVKNDNGRVSRTKHINNIRDGEAFVGDCC